MVDLPKTPTPATGFLQRRLDRLRRLRGGEGSLTARAVSSSAWILGSNVSMKALRLGSNLILVRLLAPQDFGLMALVFTLHAGLDMMTDIGLKPAVVRSDHGDDPRFLRTAWTVQIGKYALAALVLLLGAAGLATLQDNVDIGDGIYAHPDLPALVAASALILVINGFVSINVATAERAMAVQRVLVVTVTAQVVATAVIIVWALLSPSVWALLGGAVIGAALRCAMSHVLLPGPRMGLCFDPAHRVEIWGFGKWLMGSSALGFLAQHGDKLLLAALLEPLLFSFYAIARLWIDAARQTVSRVSGPIGLAALSEVRRQRPEALPRVFRKYRIGQNAACAAAFGFFLLLGDPLIGALYPADFSTVGDLMPLLAPIMLLQTYETLGRLVLAKGQSRAFAAVALWRAVTLLTGMPIVFFLFGPSWTIFFIAISGAFGVPTLLRLGSKIVPLDLRLEYAWLAAIVFGAAALAWLLPWIPT